jgi:hypothetical protein
VLIRVAWRGVLTLSAIVLASGKGGDSTLHDIGVVFKDYLPVFISLGALALAVVSYRKSSAAEKRVRDAQGEVRIEWGWETFSDRPPEVKLQVEIFNTSPFVPLHVRNVALLAVTSSTESTWHSYQEELFKTDQEMKTIPVAGPPLVMTVNPLVTKKLPWNNSAIPIYAWVRTGNNAPLTKEIHTDFEPLQEYAARWTEWPPIDPPGFVVTLVDVTNPHWKRSRWKLWKRIHPFRWSKSFWEKINV